MSDKAIIAEGLSKQYRIGQWAGYKTLRESISSCAGKNWRRFSRRGSPGSAAQEAATVWALKDASFHVSHGEVVGVIGRNGAGKSTLLKVLSRITEPTLGRALVNGRVGSLLEVGTGFHPELTGRENLFLNGAILGMKRKEIERKFDDIVAFAEIERFIDTPVKRYSSGMYMRLAFAVAAHLEPEILVVDEVLAVGDVSFQRKCLDKMESVGHQGRTVLFVSHNLPAITRLCQRALLLDNGKLVQDGAAPDVVRAYLHSMTECSQSRQWDVDGAPGSDEVKLVSVSLLRDDQPVSVVSVKDELELELRYRVLKAGSRFRCSVNLATQGVCAFSTVERTERARPTEGLYVTYETHAQGSYDSQCFLQLRTEGGLVGRVVQDVVTRPPVKRVRVQGSEGCLELAIGFEPHCDALFLHRGNGPANVQKFPKTRPDDFLQELTHIHTYLERGRVASPISLERGLDTMLVVAAAHRAELEQRRMGISYDNGYTPDAIQRCAVNGEGSLRSERIVA